MLFGRCVQGTTVIKWNIYDEYKTMQIHVLAWKPQSLVTYLNLPGVQFGLQEARRRGGCHSLSCSVCNALSNSNYWPLIAVCPVNNSNHHQCTDRCQLLPNITSGHLWKSRQSQKGLIVQNWTIWLLGMFYSYNKHIQNSMQVGWCYDGYWLGYSHGCYMKSAFMSTIFWPLGCLQG